MNKRRLLINFLATVIQFTSSLIISFFFTPFFLKWIGKEAYSFYAIAGNMISYLTVLTTALNSMASRFITIEWHKGNKEKANQYFNTVLFSNLIMSAVLSVVIVLIVIFIDSLLNVPQELLISVKWLFGMVLFSALLTTSGSIFQTSTFCSNRLELKSVVLILNSVLRVLILFILLTSLKPDILFLGISSLVTSLIEVGSNIIFTKKLLPSIHITFGAFRKKFVWLLISSGIWNSINQLNTILITGLDVLIANLLLTLSEAGTLSISKTIPSLITSLSSLIGGVFLPQFTITYAKGNKEELKNIMSLSFTVISFFLSIILAGFLVFGKTFYELWLPTENGNILYTLSVLAILGIFATGGTATQGNVFLLTNKLRLPVIVTTVRAFIGLFIVYLAIQFSDYGIYAIAGVSSILGIIYDLTFDTPYAAKCIGIEIGFFYKAKVKLLGATSILIVLFYLISKVIPTTNFIYLGLVACICIAIGITINTILFLNKEQIENIFKLLFGKLRIKI